MRGYGLPRYSDVEFPDKADITRFGLNNEPRRASVKASARRYWAKRDRRSAKRSIRSAIDG